MMQGCGQGRPSLAAVAMLVMSACTPTDNGAAAVTTQMTAGADTIRKYGCGACHVIPGIDEARGTVGPSLAGIERHVYLAGRLPNTPDNLAQWIMSPQRLSPATAMPDMQVSLADARAIATYLAGPR